PPARFSEASLIKELEREGIGRPSTYASIIDTIVRREYATKRGSALVPTFTAFAVVQLMEQYFTQLVDVGFTARMEDALDSISRGEGASLPYLKEFYFGAQRLPGLHDLLKAEIDPRQACTIALGNDSKGRPMTVRVGRFGPYLERGTERASIPANLAPDEVTLPAAEALLDKGSAPELLGSDPVTGKPVYVKTGRFGPYVQLGEMSEQKSEPRPKMKSLLPGQSPEQLTLQDALQLLSLPREVGADPESGETILADLGRYGPYLKRGSESRSLPSAASMFTITVPEAQALFRQAKTFRRGQATVLRQVGADPQSQAPINLMQGRYGPYVTDGETNASLPRGQDPAQVTLEQALQLLAARRAAGPPVRRASGRSTRRGAASGSTARPGKVAKGRKAASTNPSDTAKPAPAKRVKGNSSSRALPRTRRQQALP
ncbi:MAG TPA: topoisomerase C-terminal repeat-containing protein, partial [bacterium]|nr:topoisomerase C-terminal repeat-containing protein [bacterium]